MDLKLSDSLGKEDGWEVWEILSLNNKEKYKFLISSALSEKEMKFAAKHLSQHCIQFSIFSTIPEGTLNKKTSTQKILRTLQVNRFMW